MKIATIIVAAGRGTRTGRSGPKQWETVAGQRVIDWTLSKFSFSDAIVVVHHADDTAYLSNLPENVQTTPGGITRQDSVFEGLKKIASQDFDVVIIHDAARPCTSDTVIQACVSALRSGKNAAPALPTVNAIWRNTKAGLVSVDRRDLFQVTTPQCFQFQDIWTAHKENMGQNCADDVAVARHAGLTIDLVPDTLDNVKITHPEDFARAAKILDRSMIRVGNGYDVHKFGPGDFVTLCGVDVPHSHGLVGHSDADVGMHAITDALYGAVASGDIGQHFPPSDPQWKGAASDIFLKHAVALIRSKGFKIGNVDCTLVCEFPKIGPHCVNMRQALATIMNVDVDQVSVKATTSEKLGFTGRGEGIAAIATAALVKT